MCSDSERQDKNEQKRVDATSAFSRLYELAVTLRAPNGCPWDKKQTPQSMRRNLMEEVFETLDAITQNDSAHVKEELGDLLFNAVMIAFMYEQRDDFSVSDMLNDVCDKLVRRHPHVFASRQQANGEDLSAGAVCARWDDIKANVEARACDSVLDEVPELFPPLLKAYKFLQKAAKKGFEWPHPVYARQKIDEELGELDLAATDVAAALERENHSGFPAEHLEPLTESVQNSSTNQAQLHLEEELGDLLLSVVNFGRMLHVDPCIALDRSLRKFYRRFTHVERGMKTLGKPMNNDNILDMEGLWNEAKKLHD